MAKCPVCNDRKGKRQCRARQASICPPCCGEIRSTEACGDCGFFKPPTRDYDHLPRYSTQEMEHFKDLEAISFPIEASVCLVDRDRDYTMTDDEAVAMFELLLDLYAFGDPKAAMADRIRTLGCEKVIEIVERDLTGRPHDEISKVLSAVRFVARRRNSGGRHHMNVLQEHCGAYLRRGVGLRRFGDGTEVAVASESIMQLAQEP